jgi:hypothetical protein
MSVVLAGDLGSENTCVVEINGTTFSTAFNFVSPVCVGQPTASAVDSSGNLYIGGRYLSKIDGVATPSGIAKWNGNVWTAVGSGSLPDGDIKTMAWLGSDLYIGGDFTSINGVSANRLVKFDGTNWTVLGSGITGNRVSILVSFGSDLYVGGWFTSAGGVAGTISIAKWNGTTWSSIGTSPFVSGHDVRQFAINSANELWAVGDVTKSWNGSSWASQTSLGSNTPVAYRNNVLYKGGTRLSSWDGSSWTTVASLTGGAQSILHIRVVGSDLYVSGAMDSIGGVTVRNIAKWNGTTWSALGSGLGLFQWGYQSSLTISATHVYYVGDVQAAGEKPMKQVARWLLSGSTNADWSSLSFYGDKTYPALGGTDTQAMGAPAWCQLAKSPSVVGVVYAIHKTIPSGVAPYGWLGSIGGVSIPTGVAKYSGGAWTSLGSGTIGGSIPTSTTAMLVVSDTEIYVGGKFTTIGGTSANKIAKWNGSAWVALGAGISYSLVTAIAKDGSGNLYVGSTNESNTGYLSKWDGSAWSLIGTFPSSMDPGRILAIAINGTDIYVGGHWDTVNSVSAPYLAKYNGTTWSSIGSPDYTVFSVEFSGGVLYVGGWFSQVAGVSNTSYIAKWNGSAWSSFGTTPPDGMVHDIEVVNSDVYICGVFTSVGGGAANNCAKWDGSSWTGLGTSSPTSNTAVSILSYTADLPPTPGNSGTITTSEVSATSVTLNWTAATDNVDAPSALQYLAYYSTDSNLTSVQEIKDHGNPVGSYE